MDPIYYTKVQYTEKIRYGHLKSILLLNIPQRELSYQEYGYTPNMPVIDSVKTETFGDFETTEHFSYPGKKMRHFKTDFNPIIIKDERFDQSVSFSYGITLSEAQITELLPYCNALDFEPYRNRTMSMNDEGYIGYRDEICLTFSAITDSSIPMIELPMEYYYDDAHIWPSEKLYRYLVMTYFDSEKKLRYHKPQYGAGSLF